MKAPFNNYSISITISGANRSILSMFAGRSIVFSFPGSNNNDIHNNKKKKIPNPESQSQKATRINKNRNFKLIPKIKQREYRYKKFYAEFASFHRYTLWLHALRHVASWSKEASKPKTWPSPPKLRRSWKLGFQVQSFESAVSMQDSELTTNGLESYWESDDTWHDPETVNILKRLRPKDPHAPQGHCFRPGSEGSIMPPWHCFHHCAWQSTFLPQASQKGLPVHRKNESNAAY